MSAPYGPLQVMPGPLATAVEPLSYWFVIGGQAVRCFAPYRPSRDVDFGLDSPGNLSDLVSQLATSGAVEIQERGPDTVHLLDLEAGKELRKFENELELISSVALSADGKSAASGNCRGCAGLHLKRGRRHRPCRA